MMKIVIDIPEDVLKRTVFYREFRDLNDCVTTIKALEKATPLPEGHGRLISADNLIKTIEEKAKRLKNTDTINGLCGAVSLIFDASTIIEADEESDSE